MTRKPDDTIRALRADIRADEKMLRAKRRVVHVRPRRHRAACGGRRGVMVGERESAGKCGAIVRPGRRRRTLPLPTASSGLPPHRRMDTRCGCGRLGPSSWSCSRGTQDGSSGGLRPLLKATPR